MKINIEVDIFPDQEFCNHQSMPSCRFLDYMIGEDNGKPVNENYCWLFDMKVEEPYESILKCEPCKKAYEEATHTRQAQMII